MPPQWQGFSSQPKRWSPKSRRRRRRPQCRTITAWAAWTTSNPQLRLEISAGTRTGAGFLSRSVTCRSGLGEIEPAHDALEAAIDPVDATRNACVSRFEKARPFLDLDGRCLEVAD